MSVIPDLNYTCHSNFDYRGKRLFGLECFAPLHPVYESILDGSKSFKKVDNLPSCDTLCRSSLSSQPDFEEFMSLNRTEQLNLCDNNALPGVSGRQLTVMEDPRAIPRQKCMFNVIVDFDFKHHVWTTKRGKPLNTIQWYEGYPSVNDKLDVIVFE